MFNSIQNGGQAFIDHLLHYSGLRPAEETFLRGNREKISPPNSCMEMYETASAGSYIIRKATRLGLVRIERRRHERLNVLNWISVSSGDAHNDIVSQKAAYNYSENISVSGTKIRGNVPLAIGSMIKIDYFVNSSSEVITLTGKIVWTKMIIENEYYEAGVEFVAMPAISEQKLQDYIQSKQQEINNYPFKVSF